MFSGISSIWSYLVELYLQRNFNFDVYNSMKVKCYRCLDKSRAFATNIV